MPSAGKYRRKVKLLLPAAYFPSSPRPVTKCSALVSLESSTLLSPKGDKRRPCVNKSNVEASAPLVPSEPTCRLQWKSGRKGASSKVKNSAGHLSPSELLWTRFARRHSSQLGTKRRAESESPGRNPAASVETPASPPRFRSIGIAARKKDPEPPIPTPHAVRGSRTGGGLWD